MTNFRSWLLATVLFLSSIGASAQVGQLFWFAAPEMALHSSDMTLRLCVFADTLDADVLVQMPASSSFQKYNFHVAAGEHYEYTLAHSYADYMQKIAVMHNQVMPRAIYIVSSAPVTCYVQMTGVNGEIYTLKGENALGKDFCLAMQNHFCNSNIASARDTYKNAYASAQIVATEDSTEVDIYPTQVLYGDYVVRPRHISLNRGEVYSFRADSKSAEGHPTATRIVSNRPIVVHSMDDSMSPYTQYPGEDAVAEQLVPTSLLSNEYIALGNNLPWEGVCVTDPETGATEFIPMNGRGALYIHRDHPVQVFQITGAENEAGGTQLPKLYQSGSHRVQYKRPEDSKWAWIKILTPSTNTGAIEVNGRRVSSTLFHRVEGASQWSYASVSMDNSLLNQTITVTSSRDIMHVAIMDVSSNTKNSRGRDIPTSSSLVYFSSYAPEEDFVPVPITIVDTVYMIDTVKIEVERTTVIKDTVFVMVHDTVTLQQQDTVAKPGIHHRLGLYMLGAYSHMPFGDQSFKWGLGYGAGLGFFYEYQHRHFLLDLGLGGLWQDAEHRSTTGSDLQRFDRARTLYIEVPFLLGGTWRGFYLLGGMKVGVPIFGNTRSELRLTNEAQQRSQTYTTTEDRLHYMIDMRASLELGGSFGRCRLGAFVDYGLLLDKLDNGTTPWMQIDDPADLSTWDVHHPLHSQLANSRFARNFFAGIKFTVLLTSIEK